MKKTTYAGAGLAALAILVLASAGASAQGQASFEVQIADPGAPPQVIKEAVEVQIDDITVEHRAVATPPADAPTGLAADAKAGFRLYAPGQAHWGNARLTLAPGPDTDALFDWYSAAVGGKIDRRSISIIFHNDSGEDLGRRINLFHCWPAKWVAPDPTSGVGSQTETLEVGIGGIELLAGIEGTPKTPGKVSLGFPNADGTVAFDANWDAWSGGELARLNSSAYATTSYWTGTPGDLSVEPLVLQGAMTGSRKDLCQWVNDTVNGKPWRESPTGGFVRLRESPTLSTRGNPPNNRMYTFFDCFLTRYVFPQLNAKNSGHASEKIEIVAERVEYK